MDIDKLRNQLIRHEGLEDKVYKDTLGYKTAGIGHLLTGQDRNYPVGHPISKIQIEEWFAADVRTAIAKARRIVGEEYDEMDDVRQRVLIDLAFNMGDKLSQFHNTLRFLRQHDYEKAAENLRQSLWFKQVKSRGIEITNALATGKFSFE